LSLRPNKEEEGEGEAKKMLLHGRRGLQKTTKQVKDAGVGKGSTQQNKNFT